MNSIHISRRAIFCLRLNRYTQRALPVIRYFSLVRVYRFESNNKAIFVIPR